MNHGGVPAADRPIGGIAAPPHDRSTCPLVDVRGWRRARSRGLWAAGCTCVLFTLAIGAPEPASATQTTAPAPATDPVTSSAALLAIAGATTSTASSTAAVAYRLVGAHVFGPSVAPVAGSGSFDLARGVGEASLHQPTGTQLVVFTPQVVFTQVPKDGRAALPKGKLWLSADLTGSESVNTNFPQFVVQAESVNPLLYLDELAWGAVRATPIGSTSASSGAARGYRVSVDLQKALGHSTGSSQSDAAMVVAIQSELTFLGSNTASSSRQLDLRVWISSSGRLVKLEASPPGAGVGSVSISLSKFGTPVSVASPSLTRVVDIAALTPSGERESNGGGDSDGA
jgi:hypothetical protein